MAKLSERIAAALKDAQALHDDYVSDPLAHFEAEIEADFRAMIDENGLTMQGPCQEYLCYDASVVAEHSPTDYRCELNAHADAFELCSLDEYRGIQAKIDELEGLEKVAATAEDELEECAARLDDFKVNPLEWLPHLEELFKESLKGFEPEFSRSVEKDGLSAHLLKYQAKLQAWLAEYDWYSCDLYRELCFELDQAKQDLSRVKHEFLALIED